MAQYFESAPQVASAEERVSVVLPDVDIGPGVRLKRAVVDRYCRLPADLVAGCNPEVDRGRFHVTAGGVTLITPEMLGQEVHHLR